MSIFTLISIIILLMLSAFFSGSEIAFASLDRLDLNEIKKSNRKSSKLTLWIIDNFEAALTTILIGNNLVNIAVTSIITVAVITDFGEQAVFVSTIAMTFMILIFGEITPKLIAKVYATHFTMIASYPIWVLMKLMKPINYIVVKILAFLSQYWNKSTEELTTISEDEILCLIEENENQGLIDKDRGNLLKSTLLYSDTRVKGIITPRVDLAAIDITMSAREIKRIVIESNYTRIPVYEGDLDNVIGILHTKDYLLKSVKNDKMNISTILIDPIFIHETTKLPSVFNRLNSKHSHLGIVLDEFGGTLGCVTVEDIIEELVGEIWDENDNVDLGITSTGDSTFLVNGNVYLRDIMEYLDLPYIESECHTIGGWVIEVLEKMPFEGDIINCGPMEIYVNKTDDIKILELIVKVN